MDPQIRYARTSDGVNIAFAAFGDGPPIIEVQAPPWTHLQEMWRIPLVKERIERWSRSRRLIRYDGRGTGLSDLDVADVGLDAHVRDLEATSRDVATFDVFAQAHAVPAAITFVVRHPDRVSRLVLASGWARASDFWSTEGARFESLIDVGWETYTETIARNTVGWESQRASQMAEFLRACTTPMNARRIHDAMQSFDVRDLLAEIRVPTLVTALPKRHSVHWTDPRLLASAIPGAQLAMAEDQRAMFDAIERFLDIGVADDLTSARPTPALSGNAVILFLDIADSTALTERLGDARFRAASRALDARLRDAIRAAGGAPVEGKVMGDGVMATFTSAREAIDAALRCNALAAGAGGDSELRLHIGVHAGDVIREPGNVYGGAVNIASRICDASAPGEVLVSDVVRGMARTSAGVTFEDRGEREMKGVGDPVRVYAVKAGA